MQRFHYYSWFYTLYLSTETRSKKAIILTNRWILVYPSCKSVLLSTLKGIDFHQQGVEIRAWVVRLCTSALIGFLIRASQSLFRLGAAGGVLQPAASEQHPLKKQTMIPHFQTQRKLPCLPLCPLVLPLHICSQDQLLREKMKINNERKVREGMRICLLTWQKKKTPKESNMSSRHCDSVLCPPAFHMSHTIFRNHQRRSHVYRSVYNTRGYNNWVFVFRHLHRRCVIPNFIPRVKSHYSFCFHLIDSSFLHFISRLYAQGFISRLQSRLFWGSLFRTVGGDMHRWVRKGKMTLHVYVHWSNFFLNQSIRIIW